MKILINTGFFNGGAPLSILEYARIAQRNGYEVKAIGEYATLQVKYEQLGIPTYDVKYFAPKRFFSNIKSLWSYSRIVKKEQPNLIHATSYGIVPSKFISKLYGIPVMYSIAGGKTTRSVFDNEKLIVYSEENKEDLIKNGYRNDLIEVIPNRLSIAQYASSYKMHYGMRTEKINLLLISRLDRDVIESVYYLIDLVIALSDMHQNIHLDIVGSGEYIESVKKNADNVNKSKQRKVINILGYQSDVHRYITEAHVVFGKGRSIIEAILNDRISFVVSESRTMSRCTAETIENLYKYNFSGRNLENVTSIEELSKLIEDIGNNGVDFCKVEEVWQFVDQRYNIKHAEQRIAGIYMERLVDQSTKQSGQNVVGAFCVLIRAYYSSILNRLARFKLVGGLYGRAS